MGFHFQNSGLQALSCSGKELCYYVLHHDLVFALLQSLWRVHIFCDHADAGLAICVAMISSYSWPMSWRAEAIAASSARVIVFVAPDPLGMME